MIKKGDPLKCHWPARHHQLIKDNIYTALEDEIPGVFIDRPYVRVEGEDGYNILVWTNRFTVIGENDDGT